ncbi:hypothetical protein [Staphylococcus epidermidis]|nr:hypothetical protein [Staphylococcus epidermidis]
MGNENILELSLFVVGKDRKIIKDKRKDGDDMIDYKNSDDGKEEKDEKED